MGTVILLSLAVYVMTVVAVSSSLLAPVRRRIIKATPWLKIGDDKHPVECRLCTGFWVALLVCLAAKEWQMILPVYGLSYFLATQEQN